jgi:hypothetical protein
MGTRGAIARPLDTHEGAFFGRYHHWDSYPSALGETLYDLRRSFFAGDTDAMLRYLIDDHPAGWSTINGGDFTQPPGFVEGGFDTRGPNCYCHGGRHEDAQDITDENAADCGVEWVYVLDGPIMHILSSRNADGSKMIGMFGSGNPDASWVGVARINMDDPAPPDWSAIEARG